MQGLAYIHKQGFFHRDMKPENIMITGDLAKVCFQHKLSTHTIRHRSFQHPTHKHQTR